MFPSQKEKKNNNEDWSKFLVEFILVFLNKIPDEPKPCICSKKKKRGGGKKKLSSSSFVFNLHLYLIFGVKVHSVSSIGLDVLLLTSS